MNNNLYKMENTLRSLAKRYKSIKYSLGLVLIFLMLGINAFSEEIFTTEQVSTSKKDIKTSVENLKDKVEQVKEENEKDIKDIRLELIQLMEQGNQVVKSPWASWQFGVMTIGEELIEVEETRQKNILMKEYLKEIQMKCIDI